MPTTLESTSTLWAVSWKIGEKMALLFQNPIWKKNSLKYWPIVLLVMTLWNCIFFKILQPTMSYLKTITLIYIILKICWITTDFFSFKNSIFTCISINLKVYLFWNKWHSTGGLEFFCNKSCYEYYVHIYNIHIFFLSKSVRTFSKDKQNNVCICIQCKLK